MLEIGKKYLFKGRAVTITGLDRGLVRYQGKGIGGSSSEGYFRSQLTIMPPKKTQADVDRAIAAIKPIVPAKTAKITSTKAHIPSVEPVQTFKKEGEKTSLLTLTKTGTTKFYVIVSIIALIIIFGGFKILKKIIK